MNELDKLQYYTLIQQMEKEFGRHIDWGNILGETKMPAANDVHVKAESLDPAELVLRLLGGDAAYWQVHIYIERWRWGPDIMHIGIMMKDGAKIVRFEEAPGKFPSNQLIDKLRLLNNG